jgi:hypothetical protein
MWGPVDPEFRIGKLLGGAWGNPFVAKTALWPTAQGPAQSSRFEYMSQS